MRAREAARGRGRETKERPPTSGLGGPPHERARDDRPGGPPDELPPCERRRAAERYEAGRVHLPSFRRVVESDVAGGPRPEGAARQAEGPRRTGGEELHEPGERQPAGDDETIVNDGGCRLEPDDAERRRVELDSL